MDCTEALQNHIDRLALERDKALDELRDARETISDLMVQIDFWKSMAVGMKTDQLMPRTPDAVAMDASQSDGMQSTQSATFVVRPHTGSLSSAPSRLASGSPATDAPGAPAQVAAVATVHMVEESLRAEMAALWDSFDDVWTEILSEEQFDVKCQRLSVRLDPTTLDDLAKEFSEAAETARRRTSTTSLLETRSAAANRVAAAVAGKAAAGPSKVVGASETVESAEPPDPSVAMRLTHLQATRILERSSAACSLLASELGSDGTLSARRSALSAASMEAAQAGVTLKSSGSSGTLALPVASNQAHSRVNSSGGSAPAVQLGAEQGKQGDGAGQAADNGGRADGLSPAPPASVVELARIRTETAGFMLRDMDTLRTSLSLTADLRGIPDWLVERWIGLPSFTREEGTAPEGAPLSLAARRACLSMHRPLLDLLIGDTPQAAAVRRALCSLSAAADGMDEVASLLVCVLVPMHNFVPFALFALEHEIGQTQTSTTLFRLNSLGTRLIAAFLRLVCAESLHAVLGQMLERFADEHALRVLDLSSADEAVRVYSEARLAFWGRELLTLLEANVATIPTLARQLCFIIFKTVRVRFPDSGYLAVGSAFFLRFVVPAIVRPVAYGLLPDSSPAAIDGTPLSRSLLQLSKLVQNLAAGVVTAHVKTPSHQCLDDFVSVTLERRDKFYLELMLPGADTAPVPIDVQAAEQPLVADATLALAKQLGVFQADLCEALRGQSWTETADFSGLNAIWRAALIVAGPASQSALPYPQSTAIFARHVFDCGGPALWFKLMALAKQYHTALLPELQQAFIQLGALYGKGTTFYPRLLAAEQPARTLAAVLNSSSLRACVAHMRLCATSFCAVWLAEAIPRLHALATSTVDCSIDDVLACVDALLGAFERHLAAVPANTLAAAIAMNDAVRMYCGLELGAELLVVQRVLCPAILDLRINGLGGRASMVFETGRKALVMVTRIFGALAGGRTRDDVDVTNLGSLFGSFMCLRRPRMLLCLEVLSQRGANLVLLEIPYVSAQEKRTAIIAIASSIIRWWDQVASLYSLDTCEPLVETVQYSAQQQLDVVFSYLGLAMHGHLL